MGTAPAEIRAFLIADVRGYTRFTVERGDEAAARLAAAFAELVRASVSGLGGEVVELRGDEALVVFSSARQAVRAALELQRRCAEHTQAVAELPLRVGAGLDAGEAVPVLGGFRGQALNLAARLCSLAAPDEVLASDSLTHLAGRLEDVRYEPRGSVQLKGFAEPVAVVAVEAARAASPAPEAAGAAVEERLPIGAYLGSLPAGPLVGREAERDRLLAIIDAVGPGSGRLVLLAGEPGAGKTRLVQEAMISLRNRSFAIATGACLETRQTVPYFPFLDVLPKLAEAHRRAGLGDLGRWPNVERLIAGQAVGAGAAEAEEERVRRDVAAFIGSLSGTVPVAILLDDLHWADGSSLELLHQLARQLRGERVFMTATYRDVEVLHDHPLEVVLRGLRRDELADTIAVKRLDAGGTAALMAASFGQERVSEEFSSLIHQQTDGNPFFVQQVLRALVERGDVYREGEGWERRELGEIEVPESIRAAVGERVARLPEASREALVAASVLGQRFEFDDLMPLASISEDDLEAALEAAVESGLLRSESRDRYAFEHALAQQTLLAEIPARRRRRLHGLAGAAIAPAAERDPARAAEVAYHLVEADEPARAAPWSLAAGRHANQVVALTEAEAHFRQAVELAEDARDRDLVRRALDELASVLARRGRQEAALEVADRARAAHREAGDVDAEGRAVALKGRGLLVLGAARDVPALVRGFLDSRAVGEATRAELLLVLARAQFSIGDMEGLLESATAAEQAARAAGDRGLLVEALGRHGLADQHLRGGAAAKLVYHEAVALIDETVPLEIAAVVHNNLAWTLHTLGDFAGNVEHRRRASELAARYANPGYVAFGTAMVAQAELNRGRVADALALSEQASALIVGSEETWHVSYVLGQSGTIKAVLGEVEEAERLFRLALGAAVGRGDRQLATWISYELAMLLTDSGRPEEGRRVALEELAHDSVFAHRVVTALAHLEVASGETAEAVAHAREAVERTLTIQSVAEQVESQLVLGEALAAAGEGPEARSVLEEAIRLAEPMPYPLTVARARLELAKIARAEGDAEGEAAALRSAEELIDRHGFVALRRRLALRELA